MPLHPQAQAVITQIAALARPPMSELTVAQARDGLTALLKVPGPAVGDVRDFTIAGAAGQPMRMRAYRPADAPAGPLPVVLSIHGGGWVTGDLDGYDAVCRALTNASGCLVVAVDYRLAPECKFPGGLDDCYAALEWLAANAASLGGRADRLAIAGDSAGGNLAAAVTLMARDHGGPVIRHQMLVYPVTNHAFDTPSYLELAEGYLLTLEGMRWHWNHYLPDAAAGANALASPLRAADLSGLPPALVITAEFDPLRDESEAYARRLAQAGVPVELRRFDGMIHGFFSLGNLFDSGRDAVALAGAALREALAG